MYKWCFGSDVRFWNMISCCLNAFKVKRSFSSRVKVHELWEFLHFRVPEVKKERAEPGGLTGEKLADEGLLLLERETELLAATERDRASCCCWGWRSSFAAAEWDGVLAAAAVGDRSFSLRAAGCGDGRQRDEGASHQPQPGPANCTDTRRYC